MDWSDNCTVKSSALNYTRKIGFYWLESAFLVTNSYVLTDNFCVFQNLLTHHSKIIKMVWAYRPLDSCHFSVRHILFVFSVVYRTCPTFYYAFTSWFKNSTRNNSLWHPPCMYCQVCKQTWRAQRHLLKRTQFRVLLFGMHTFTAIIMLSSFRLSQTSETWQLNLYHIGRSGSSCFGFGPTLPSFLAW